MSAIRAPEIEPPDGMETPQSPPTLFDAVAKRDYDGMVGMYATNAKNAVASYLAMKSRWTSSVSLAEHEEKSGEQKTACTDITLNSTGFNLVDLLPSSSCRRCRADLAATRLSLDDRLVILYERKNGWEPLYCVQNVTAGLFYLFVQC